MKYLSIIVFLIFLWINGNSYSIDKKYYKLNIDSILHQSKVTYNGTRDPFILEDRKHRASIILSDTLINQDTTIIRTFYPTGELRLKDVYIKGVLVSYTDFYQDGTLLSHSLSNVDGIKPKAILTTKDSINLPHAIYSMLYKGYSDSTLTFIKYKVITTYLNSEGKKKRVVTERNLQRLGDSKNFVLCALFEQEYNRKGRKRNVNSYWNNKLMYSKIYTNDSVVTKSFYSSGNLLEHTVEVDGFKIFSECFYENNKLLSTCSFVDEANYSLVQYNRDGEEQYRENSINWKIVRDGLFLDYDVAYHSINSLNRNGESFLYPVNVVSKKRFIDNRLIEECRYRDDDFVELSYHFYYVGFGRYEIIDYYGNGNYREIRQIEETSRFSNHMFNENEWANDGYIRYYDENGIQTDEIDCRLGIEISAHIDRIRVLVIFELILFLIPFCFMFIYRKIRKRAAMSCLNCGAKYKYTWITYFKSIFSKDSCSSCGAKIKFSFHPYIWIAKLFIIYPLNVLFLLISLYSIFKYYAWIEIDLICLSFIFLLLFLNRYFYVTFAQLKVKK